MGGSDLPRFHVTIGASVALNLYAFRNLCNIIVATRDNKFSYSKGS